MDGPASSDDYFFYCKQRKQLWRSCSLLLGNFYDVHEIRFHSSPYAIRELHHD